MKLRRIIPLACALLLTGCGTAPFTTSSVADVTSLSAEAGTTGQQQTDTQTETTAAAQTTAASASTSISMIPSAQLPGESWMFLLANKAHPIGEYAPPELTTLKNNVQIDSRIYPALQKMYDDMRAQGLSPYTREGYRTYAQQLDIMQTRIKTYRSQGYSEEKAKSLAEQYVAVPGTSEHQLGLAVDINSTDGNSWKVYNWLALHAQDYGFILRYPSGKESITGYAYEAWHYRYVGTEAAKEIYAAKLTLEEYLEKAELK